MGILTDNENEDIVSESTAVQATSVADSVVEDVPEVQSSNLISKANEVLEYLAAQAVAYRLSIDRDVPEGVARSTWKDRLDLLVTDKEATAAHKVVRKILGVLTDERVEVVPSGTSILNNVPDLSTGQAAAIINLLKEHNRIVQCGRGRGKALVIVDSSHLASDTVVPEAVTQSVAVSAANNEEVEVVMSNDVPNLLRAARDQYREIRRAKEEAERSLRHANNRIQELEVQLEAKDVEIASWQRRLNQQALTTWQ